MPRAPTTALELIDLVRKSGIVSSEKLAGVSDLTLPREPRKAAAALVSQGIVTQFQATQLLAGRHKGFKIGAYTVLDLIGRGGMGAVYLAEHMALHRKVAIKVLVPGKEDDQKLAMERFQREARSAAALDHPNIVRIFDVARHNEVPYLVMEYVEGETLQQVVDRDGPVPYTTATEYIAQAAAGLQHAYEKGFVHRDIKPCNLMRDKTGTIKILDMGLARSSDAQDKLTAQLDNGAVVGTADFIAPEQAINNPSVDIRADIYSLGATLFALIIGKPPFEGNTTQKLLQHQLRSAPSLDSLDATLPKALSHVVAKMLGKKPEERYSTPAEVISALTPWMASSARILVGISQTSLAEDESLQATLSGFHRKNTNRLPSIADTDTSDSSEFHVLESGQVTESMSTSETRRDKKRPNSEPSKPRKLRPAVLIPVAVVVLAAGGLGGWLAFGRDRKPDVAVPDSQPVQKQPPVNVPSANTNRLPIDEAPDAEKVIYQFDAAAQKLFNIRIGSTNDPNDSNNKVVKTISRSGPGEPPSKWVARCYNKDSEMEFFAEAIEGRTAMGIRNVQGPGSAMLFTPTFECPTGLCRLKFEYQASLKDKRFLLKFKPSDERKAWEVANPQVTGEVWRTEDLIVDMQGAKGGFFELHNSDSSPTETLRLRSLTIKQLKPNKNSVSSTPAPVDYSTWVEGESLYKLDIAKIPAFRVKKEQFTVTSGEPEVLPFGIGCLCWKENAVGEFRCEKVDDVPALMLANLSEELSAQYYLQLEEELKVPFQPGKAYRVKVGYLSRKGSVGSVAVQVTPGYKTFAATGLPDSEEKWAMAAVSFVRPPAEDNVDVRMVIDNNSFGENNTICIRSIEIVALVPPK